MTNIWKKYRTLIGTSGTKTHKTGITTESFTQCTLLTDKDIHLQKSVFLKSLWTELMYLYHIYMNYSVEIQQYIYPLNLPYMMLWKITSEMVMVKYCLNSKKHVGKFGKSNALLHECKISLWGEIFLSGYILFTLLLKKKKKTSDLT